MKSNSTVIKEILSTGVGIGTFLALGASSIPILLSGAAAVGVYIGTKLMFTSPNQLKLISLPKEVRKTIDDISSQLNNVDIKSKQVKDSSIRKKLEEVLVLGNQITLVLTNNVNTYDKLNEIYKILDSVLKITDKYLFLSSQNVDYTKMNDSFKEFNELLDSIIDALKIYYKKGLSGEVLDMDVEMRVLKTKIESSIGIDEK